MKIKKNIAAMDAYVPGRTIQGAVKLSSNENPLGPSPKALEAINDCLLNLHRYPDGSCGALVKKIAGRWNCRSENVIAANGSDEVFSLLTAAWLAPGENALSSVETFSQYRYAVRLFGGEMREIPLQKGQFNLEKLAGSINKKTRFVFLCNPNSPTGTYRTHTEIEDFLKSLPSDVIVVLDEAYADFSDAPDFPDSVRLMNAHGNLVVTRTFSKVYGLAGLRVGYGVGNDVLIGGAKKAAMPFSVNAPAQSAAIAALDDEVHYRTTRNLVLTEKKFICEGLKERNLFHFPTQANFICIDVRRDAESLWRPIAERGIAVRGLKSFSLPNMIRYTFGTRENNEKFLSILNGLL